MNRTTRAAEEEEAEAQFVQSFFVDDACAKCALESAVCLVGSSVCCSARFNASFCAAARAVGDRVARPSACANLVVGDGQRVDPGVEARLQPVESRLAHVAHLALERGDQL